MQLLLVLSPHVFVTERKEDKELGWTVKLLYGGSLTEAADAESGGAGAGGGAAEPVAVGRAVTGAVVSGAGRARVVLEAHDGEERED